MVLGEMRFTFFVAFSNGKSSSQRLPILLPKGLQKIFILLHTIAASFPNMVFYDDSWSISEDFLKKSLGQLEHFTREAAQGHLQALTLFLGVLY